MFRRNPSCRSFSPSVSRFSLGDLFASLTIVALTAFFLSGVLSAPLQAQTREKAQQSACASNIKQLELGFMQYCQDYDEKFPLAASQIKKGVPVLSGWAVTHNKQGKAAVLANRQGTSDRTQGFAVSPVMPYLKNVNIFHCPSVTAPDSGPLSYMMNDLASAKSLAAFSSPAATVQLCDGEDFAGNAGHAYDPLRYASPAQFSANGDVVTGAVLHLAPLRHSGGANYGFADGHVKWFKPSAIFFPPRSSSSASHDDGTPGRKPGPDPGDSNAMAAKGFSGTFHIN